MRGEDIMKILDIQIGDPLLQKSDVEFFYEKNKFLKHEFLKNIKIAVRYVFIILIPLYSLNSILCFLLSKFRILNITDELIKIPIRQPYKRHSKRSLFIFLQ